MIKQPKLAIAKVTASRPKCRGCGRIPAFRPVQFATLVDYVPACDRWLHEMKYDGYRHRRRRCARLAVPLTWQELRGLDSPARRRVRDGRTLAERADAKVLRGWGRVDQVLPGMKTGGRTGSGG